jgi:hypothetical protein
MKEFLERAKVNGSYDKTTATLYRTMTWEKKAKVIFFYLHESLGYKNAELTCLIFNITVHTFLNWIKQEQYFEKWNHYVEAFDVSLLLPSIPSSYRDNYDSVDPLSKVILESKNKINHSGKVYVSAASSGSRHQQRKIANRSDAVIYLRQDSKTAGS